MGHWVGHRLRSMHWWHNPARHSMLHGGRALLRSTLRRRDTARADTGHSAGCMRRSRTRHLRHMRVRGRRGRMHRCMRPMQGRSMLHVCGA